MRPCAPSRLRIGRCAILLSSVLYVFGILADEGRQTVALPIAAFDVLEAVSLPMVEQFGVLQAAIFLLLRCAQRLGTIEGQDDGALSWLHGDGRLFDGLIDNEH